MSDPNTSEGVRLYPEADCPEVQDASLHDIGPDLHWDEQRRSMVSDCRKCGRTFCLVQSERESS